MAFTALLAAIFRRPLRQGFAKLGSVLSLQRQQAGAPASSMKMEDVRDEIPSRPDGGQRQRLRTLVKIFAVCALFAAMIFGRAELTVVGEFKIRPEHNTDVRAEVEGLIEEVYVDEGDAVSKGDPIARLADLDYRAELRAINAQIDEEQAHLRLLKAGPRQEEIESARASVEKNEQRLKYAKNELARRKELFARYVVSRQELDRAEEAVAVREKELKEADAKLRVLLAGSRPEEIEASEANLARLQARRAHLEEDLQRVRVVSPISGIVTTAKVKEKVGRRVKKGDLIAKVHSLKMVIAEIAVPEKEISDVRVGQPVTLKARAYPFEHFDGTVVSIAPIVTQDKAPSEAWQKTVLVTTQLDNSRGLLKADMTGHAKIYSGERRIVELLTRRLTRYVRVEFWSWW